MRRVETRDTFLDALREGYIDLILADYSVPSFDGMSALELSGREAPESPFLFVSTTIGEETAIDAMPHGATDYVFEQRPGRLVSSIQRALPESHERLERIRAEQALVRRENNFVNPTKWRQSADWQGESPMTPTTS